MSRKSNIVRIPKKGSNALLILFLVLFLAFVIGLGFFVNQRQEQKQKSESISGSAGKMGKKETAKIINKKEKKKEGSLDRLETEKKEEEKTAIYTGDFFSVDYPISWQAKKINSKTVGFFAKETTSGLGDVTISYKENKKNLPIERFYDGINDVNLFEDARGGFEKTSVSGYEAFRFKNLVGETNSTMLVIKLDKAFLEVSDNFSKHQEDGVFDGFVESLEMK